MRSDKQRSSTSINVAPNILYERIRASRCEMLSTGAIAHGQIILFEAFVKLNFF